MNEPASAPPDRPEPRDDPVLCCICGDVACEMYQEYPEQGHKPYWEWYAPRLYEDAEELPWCGSKQCGHEIECGEVYRRLCEQ